MKHFSLSASFTPAAILLALAACGGGGGGSSSLTAPAYALTAAPLQPASITAGGRATSTVTVTPSNGYTGSVSLSCHVSNESDLSPVCSISPTSAAITGATNFALTVSTSINSPGGDYSISVTAIDAANHAPSDGPQTLTLTNAAAIQHVVVIFQENRTPDNLFHDPVLISRGADIATSGSYLGKTIPLTSIDLGTVGPNPQNYDLNHSHNAFVKMYDGGKMDEKNPSCGPAAECPPKAHQNFWLAYVDPADVQPYFALAERYTFGDRMFQTNEGPSFPAHQFILAGTSAPTTTSPLFAAENGIGTSAEKLNGVPTGCIAPPTQTVAMIDAAGSETAIAPEYPCFEHPTLTDLLETDGITWRYYVPSAGSIWTAPNAIEHMCQEHTINGVLTCTGPQWNQGVVIPQTQVLTDITNRQLAQVSWVVPSGLSSDHPSVNDGSGPSWVASIVNAIGESPYWSSTAIIITWDDWGGWYDHVAPRVVNDGISWGSGYVYGMRVPLIVVSPYAKTAYISHVTHDFGSILKFIETTFKLPSLNYADGAADDLADCFNLTQPPTTFSLIPAALDAAYFIKETRPPTDPDDD